MEAVSHNNHFLLRAIDVTLSILQSQFIEEVFKKTDNFEHKVVSLVLLITIYSRKVYVRG